MKPFQRSFDGTGFVWVYAHTYKAPLFQSLTVEGYLGRTPRRMYHPKLVRHLFREEAPMIPFTRWLDMVQWIRTVNGDCSVYIQIAGGQRSTYTYHYQTPPPPLTTRKGPAKRVIPRRED